jgi:hypothetical protein
LDLIIDFDGTLADLSGNWEGLRSSLGVRSLRDVWNFDDAIKFEMFQQIQNFEILGLPVLPRINLKICGIFEKWSILTNNSEETVRVFLESCRPGFGFEEPRRIIGREILGGSKEDFLIFQSAIHEILDMHSSRAESTLYVGDQSYEKTYALELGLKFEDANPLDTLEERLEKFKYA